MSQAESASRAPLSVDALLPAEIARKAETVGQAKAALGLVDTVILAVLAGAFIALGAAFSLTVATGGTDLPYGVTRLLVGLVFTIGLVLVVLAGAELFTGNNLIVMAWASRLVSTVSLLRNWALVYVGNLVGALLTVGLLLAAKFDTFAGGEVGATIIRVGAAKADLGFGQALALGALCNALVCLAVWLSYGAHSTVDKVVAIVPPITAFVACGFEHSVANMAFLPLALAVDDGSALTLSDAVLNNLIPVTLGNIVGGALMVGAVYWLVYRRPRHDAE